MLFWLGLLVYFVLMLFFMALFRHFFPDANTFLSSVVSVLPSVIIWNQINITLMRKYYKHILERRS